MRSSKHSAWLNRFAWFTALATLLLICSGGLVTSKGVGLAVPDWPTTFGYNMFLFPVSQWVGGIFFEHTHRLIASAVGFLTIILCVWLYLAEARRWVRVLGFVALGTVIVQGVLGGLRVTMLKDEIGIFHACLAQAFLGLLVLIALVTTTFWRSLASSNVEVRPLTNLAIATTLLIYLQLGLGATMRHQHHDLALLDFPTANGSWIPDTSVQQMAAINTWRDARGISNVSAFEIWLQMAHRFGAVIIAVGVVICLQRSLGYVPSHPGLRGLALGWAALLVCQVSLGAWTIWSNKAADIATAHVAVGAVMLSWGVAISAICYRLSRSLLLPVAPERETRRVALA